MSGREWQPGDVAMVTWDNESPSGKARGKSQIKTSVGVRHDEGWAFGAHEFLSDEQIATPALQAKIRPLVVIDPEDTDEVARLLSCLIATSSDPGVTAYLPDMRYRDAQAALREFANPTPPRPKPLLDRLKERALGGLIAPALAERVVKEWLADNADDMGVIA